MSGRTKNMLDRIRVVEDKAVALQVLAIMGLLVKRYPLGAREPLDLERWLDCWDDILDMDLPHRQRHELLLWSFNILGEASVKQMFADKPDLLAARARAAIRRMAAFDPEELAAIQRAAHRPRRSRGLNLAG
jgi:hypothetical protein